PLLRGPGLPGAELSLLRRPARPPRPGERRAHRRAARRLARRPRRVVPAAGPRPPGDRGARQGKECAAMSARRRGVLLLAVLVVLAGAGGWWWYGRTGAAAPPAIDLEGVDSEAAAAITAARQEVLRAPRSAARWGQLGMVLRAHSFGDEANAC